MEYQLQFISNFMKKFHGSKDRLPAATVLVDNSRTSMYCAICLGDVCGGDSYRELPDCSHCFHAHCIDAWFRSHSTCPLCRTQVPHIITLIEEDQHQWGALLSNILLLLKNFVENMCNPLNHELSSMLCDNVRCIS